MTDQELLDLPLREAVEQNLIIACVEAKDRKNSKTLEENKNYKPRGSNSHALHGFGSDEMGGIHGMMSHADGKYYDSKSKYRAELKAHGYIEMGTDAPRERNNDVRGEFVSKKEIAEVVNRFS